MASESVSQTNKQSRSALDARNRHDAKLAQAEALAKVLAGEEFCTFNDEIQQNVLWLLGDLLTEAREALEDCERKEALQ